VGAADAGSYSCVVSNNCGSVTSNPASTTVCGSPVITQQPQDSTVDEGDDAVFTVAASGCGPLQLQYQWKKDGANVGGDSNSMLLSDVHLSDSNSVITCEVSNTCGTVTTDPAVLTVYPYAPDVEIRLVALGSPSSSETTQVLPSSIDSVSLGRRYYVEVWASDVGSTNTGLTSVYVDSNYIPCGAASIQSIDHNGPFGQFVSGTPNSCGIDELGGSALPEAGMAPEWARVAVVSISTDECGMVTHSLSESTTGVAALGRLQIPWSDIDLGDVTLEHTLPVIYVDGAAIGANNGTSWANAFVYLQDAFDYVQSSSCQVSEVRVAQGVYKPDCNSTYPNGTGDRQATFQLINGVAIKGSYAGFGEPYPDARDTEAYKTILSGDLNGDDVDVNDPCDLLNEPNRAENSYHVVTGTNADATALLDGFTIIAGNAADAAFPHDRGGGLFNDWSDPTVTGCTFSKNAALFAGGAMYNLNSSSMVTRCTFSRNSASSGGGMYNDTSDPNVTNCTFSGNSNSGMYDVNSNPNVTNCTFSGSSNSGMYNVNSAPNVTNCTFSGNSGGGMYDSNSNPTVTNCILWGNDGPQIYNDSSSPTVTYSDVQGGYAGTGNIDADPRFDHDYHLFPWSPCVNAGDNDSVPADITDIDGDGNTTEPIPFDIEGNPRIVGDAIDMGAYEWQDANVYGAFRDLPAYPVDWPLWQVRILIHPESPVSVYAVEDTPPSGWTPDINSINEGGTWDQARGKVKWGTFPDSNTRVLTYELAVPTGTVGCHAFSGVFSFDGFSQPTGGEDEICVGWEHPADTDFDWCLVVEEVTGYEACYLTGCTWNVGPNPIGAAYVSRAGYLWRRGECYYFDYDHKEPIWWQDSEGEGSHGSATATVSEGLGGSVTRSLDAANYVAGSDITVCLEIGPKPGTQAFVIEDAPPVGWHVSAINEGGVWDAVNRKVKWGLFFSDSKRTLCYDITPTYGATGVEMFSGVASFDGANITSIRGITDKVGDFTLDNKVDFDDLSVLCNHWLQDRIFVDIAPPQTGDSIINLADFAEFSKRWLDGTEP
jgi:parallel beta-helix repeat protein